MIDITCNNPAPPVAIVQRSVRPGARPPLVLTRKPVQRRSRVLVTCAKLPAPSLGRPLPVVLQADALPFVAALPAVPGAVLAEPVQPLAFDAPGAGPAPKTWTLASAPPPAWLPPALLPWSVPAQQLPVVPEPATWLLLLAGVAVITWRIKR